MSSARPRGSERRPKRRWGLRTTLLLGMLVPLVGLVALAGVQAERRWTSSEASEALADGADRLGETADFLAALGKEEAYSNILGLALELRLDGDQVDLEVARARLNGARALVDSDRFADLRALIDGDGSFGRLREQLDRGTAGYSDVARRFTILDELLETTWLDALAEVEDIADRQPLSAELRARLRAVSESMEALGHADDRIQRALALLLGPPLDDDLRALLDATSRFEAAREAAIEDAGPLALARWELFGSTGAVQRTEQTLELAVGIGLGRVPAPTTIPPELWVQGLEDGAVWAVRVIDTVRAAAGELEQSAARQAAADSAGLSTQIAGVALLITLSLALALVIARQVTVPAAALEAAARQVGSGDLEVGALSPRGPRELAATVVAFNDMAATLAAVEDHAVALAEDPSSPVLDDPLPGRTGRAMQAAIDRLRRSISDAEDHRAELEELASHDGLTGLLNRSAAYVEIERELARAVRDGRSLLAVYVDLDGLKDLNDTYGHQAGDQAILRTADALRSTTRRADVVARLGGDEFMVVGPVPPGGPTEVLAFAERIHAAVGHQRVPTPSGAWVSLRCSVGVALSNPASDTAEALIRTADAAMYRAKAGGRDRVDLADPPTGAAAELV